MAIVSAKTGRDPLRNSPAFWTEREPLPSLNASLALDILRTDPVAVIGGALLENSFLSRPGNFWRSEGARYDFPKRDTEDDRR